MDMMTPTDRPGKMLRIKQGFNPNSSSMGSIIFALPVSLMAATVGFSAISGLVLQHYIRRPSEKESTADKTAPDAAGDNGADVADMTSTSHQP
jgi:hypothetical protein